ncbi:MAG: DNA topoisomerase I [Candidatus Bathyarchaeota archaeon]|nr:DNA topoisomerase I [Candidatus Bathyarchaeota archaeon]
MNKENHFMASVKTLKTLRHNGIYVPTYDYKGFAIKIQGHTIKLGPKSEQMALVWAKKLRSPSPPDKVFYKNFMQDFLNQLKLENPSADFLARFSSEHLNSIEKDSSELSNCMHLGDVVDFSEIFKYLDKENQKKLNLTKKEKKKLAKQRKIQKEALKKKFGYAFVDGKKIEIANWTAEPSCLFSGRGNHPKRGKWKEGPSEEDIILNLSPDSPKPEGKWKAIVWEPDKMYIAKWQDKLTGKIKYVWFSDSAHIKQKKEKEKYKKAEKLGKFIPKIEAHIMKNLESKNDERRKIATVCWLIHALNMRVGDEKDPGEADTVGAITLRPEHVRIEGDTLHFDFLGKDSVRWVRQAKAPPSVIKNIEHYSKTCKEYLFEGIDSRKVSRFLSEKMRGLTAKVFRTWRTTKAVKEYLDTYPIKKEDPIYVKVFHAKMANLKGAEIANHKRKIPNNFEERLAKKEAKLKELELGLEEKRKQGKKTEAIIKRIEKIKLDIELMKNTRDYNLTTSLKSYIDPRVYAKWAAMVGAPIDKIYSKALRKKFSWALKKLIKLYA